MHVRRSLACRCGVLTRGCSMICDVRVFSSATHFVITYVCTMWYAEDVRRSEIMGQREYWRERHAITELRTNGCAPSCRACALGIHDVESGTCPCCGEMIV